MKAALLVNGVPASGKSAVAKAIASRLSVPLLALDTVKQPLFTHFGTGDREHNRKLGRASYEIMFSAIGDWPHPCTVVIDAWFGFQPVEILEQHLALAGVTHKAELWCHAPPAVIGERYAARVTTRSEGHPGLDYVPELVALAARAKPTGCAPCLAVDTTKPLDLEQVLSWFENSAIGAGCRAQD